MEVYEQAPNLSEAENVAALLKREQHWLNPSPPPGIDPIPADLIYNFNPLAIDHRVYLVKITPTPFGRLGKTFKKVTLLPVFK